MKLRVYMYSLFDMRMGMPVCHIGAAECYDAMVEEVRRNYGSSIRALTVKALPWMRAELDFNSGEITYRTEADIRKR